MTGSSKWYLALMFANTSGGKARSLVNGLPGAECIKKKETVIKINNVGMASKMRFEINVSIKITGLGATNNG